MHATGDFRFVVVPPWSSWESTLSGAGEPKGFTRFIASYFPSALLELTTESKLDTFSLVDLISTTSSQMHRLLSRHLPIATIVFIAHCAAAQTQNVPVPCAPLADYVDPSYQENFEAFMAGGEISSDVPVMLTVPRTEISLPNPQVKLCIEDLPIPTSVGDVPCDEWQKCWLIIGRHTGSNLNPDDVQYCKSSDSYRRTAPCYQCTCSGSDFGTGSVPSDRTLTDACGLSSQNNWGTVCPDVMNGRYNTSIGAYSNSSTIQINICGGIVDDCSICQGGGYQPSFRVGLQWSNQMDQCFANNPFTSGGSAFKSYHILASMISVSAAAASLFF